MVVVVVCTAPSPTAAPPADQKQIRFTDVAAVATIASGFATVLDKFWSSPQPSLGLQLSLLAAIFVLAVLLWLFLSEKMPFLAKRAAEGVLTLTLICTLTVGYLSISEWFRRNPESTALLAIKSTQEKTSPFSAGENPDGRLVYRPPVTTGLGQVSRATSRLAADNYYKDADYSAISPVQSRFSGQITVYFREKDLKQPETSHFLNANGAGETVSNSASNEGPQTAGEVSSLVLVKSARSHSDYDESTVPLDFYGKYVAGYRYRDSYRDKERVELIDDDGSYIVVRSDSPWLKNILSSPSTKLAGDLIVGVSRPGLTLPHSIQY